MYKTWQDYKRQHSPVFQINQTCYKTITIEFFGKQCNDNQVNKYIYAMYVVIRDTFKTRQEYAQAPTFHQNGRYEFSPCKTFDFSFVAGSVAKGITECIQFV